MMPLNLYQPDACCGRDLMKALLSGALDNAESWTHEKCGGEWRCATKDGVRYWAPFEFIEVWPI